MLALFLTGSCGVTRHVDLDAENLRDQPVLHALGQQPEHPLLKRAQLGQELRDDKPVLTDQCRALGAVVARLLEHIDDRAALGKNLAAATLVAMEVQRTVLEPSPQRMAKMLLAGISALQKHLYRVLVDVLKLLGCEAPALAEAACDS
jgi:hypothetical protein